MLVQFNTWVIMKLVERESLLYQIDVNSWVRCIFIVKNVFWRISAIWLFTFFLYEKLQFRLTFIFTGKGTKNELIKIEKSKVKKDKRYEVLIWHLLSYFIIDNNFFKRISNLFAIGEVSCENKLRFPEVRQSNQVRFDMQC